VLDELAYEVQQIRYRVLTAEQQAQRLADEAWDNTIGRKEAFHQACESLVRLEASQPNEYLSKLIRLTFKRRIKELGDG
jgi:hypothetical protein